MPPNKWYDRCVAGRPVVTLEEDERLFPLTVSLGHNQVLITYTTNSCERLWKLLTLREDLTVSETAMWTPVSSVSRPAMAVFDGYLVVYSVASVSEDSDALEATMYLYSLEKRVWETVEHCNDVCPSPAEESILFTLNGHLSGGYKGDLWCFDIKTRVWTDLHLNTPRCIICDYEIPLVTADSCYFLSRRGFSLSWQGGSLVSRDEKVISHSTGLSMPYTPIEASIGDGSQRVVLSSMTATRYGLQTTCAAHVLDSVSMEMVPLESIPVRCGGWGRTVTAAMLNPTTAVVVGYRDVVVVDVGSHLQTSEFYSD
ncbi:hypothetical protein KIPB_007240 [Kipferlia bialata]|uniref:Uncharacterized protein n=1 Tax=Kipferlia bialata TaxID=797122 RepID=A0A9K3CZR4_9EUKA|nr:hypothetical protein KIPB_007240 [Kipferlia bialata]|eukprot:g7240.t1